MTTLDQEYVLGGQPANEGTIMKSIVFLKNKMIFTVHC